MIDKEELAIRLRDFVANVEFRARPEFPNQMKVAPEKAAPEDPLLAAYESSLDALSNEERQALGTILSIMIAKLA